MSTFEIKLANFDFDDQGRVIVADRAVADVISAEMASAAASNTNGGCSNNGCGNNGKCDEAMLMPDEISWPNQDGSEELIINNPKFNDMIKNIKAAGELDTISVTTFAAD